MTAGCGITVQSDGGLLLICFCVLEATPAVRRVMAEDDSALRRFIGLKQRPRRAVHLQLRRFEDALLSGRRAHSDLLFTRPSQRLADGAPGPSPCTPRRACFCRHDSRCQHSAIHSWRRAASVHQHHCSYIAAGGTSAHHFCLCRRRRARAQPHSHRSTHG